MTRKKSKDPGASFNERSTRIKRLAIIAMFSDDDLLDRLVLKGGNALELVHGVTTRASVDLDFSIDGTFAAEELDNVRERIDFRLRQAFAPAGYTIFDVKLQEKPENLTPDLAVFWGGYALEFKLIETVQFVALQGKIEDIRRRAIPVGPSNRARFEMDISKFEYCSGKQAVEFDGYTIYVYTPEMIACEKLRAICQQMPEYCQQVKKRQSARARDFLDFHDLVRRFDLDLTNDENRRLFTNVFKKKRVSLHLLGQISESREFHRQDWPAVETTVRPGVHLETFDYYFEYVVGIASRFLEALGHM